jgi:hypothetical protein
MVIGREVGAHAAAKHNHGLRVFFVHGAEWP